VRLFFDVCRIDGYPPGSTHPSTV